jgi:large-conductance mechanosensitive channel
MSSYSEFKSDTKSLAGGVIVFIIIGALIQLSVALIILGLCLLIIPIARLILGKGNEDKIQAIKAGVFYGVAIGVIVSFFIVAFSILFNAPAFQSIHISPEQEAINEKSFEKMRIEEYGTEWNEEYKKRQNKNPNSM